MREYSQIRADFSGTIGTREKIRIPLESCFQYGYFGGYHNSVAHVVPEIYCQIGQGSSRDGRGSGVVFPGFWPIASKLFDLQKI